jgi:hypothetical protein
MANTMTLISSVTVGSGGAASISFTGIPSTFTDLSILISGRDGSASGTFEMRPNNATANRTTKELYGTGAAAGSQSQTAFYFDMEPNNFTASTFGSAQIYIPNYASSNYKSMSTESVSENNSTTSYVRLTAWLWSDTTAISSLYFYPSSGNIAQYSTAYLYGVKNA